MHRFPRFLMNARFMLILSPFVPRYFLHPPLSPSPFLLLSVSLRIRFPLPRYSPGTLIFSLYSLVLCAVTFSTRIHLHRSPRVQFSSPCNYLHHSTTLVPYSKSQLFSFPSSVMISERFPRWTCAASRVSSLMHTNLLFIRLPLLSLRVSSRSAGAHYFSISIDLTHSSGYFSTLRKDLTGQRIRNLWLRRDVTRP